MEAMTGIIIIIGIEIVFTSTANHVRVFYHDNNTYRAWIAVDSCYPNSGYLLMRILDFHEQDVFKKKKKKL